MDRVRKNLFQNGNAIAAITNFKLSHQSSKFSEAGSNTVNCRKNSIAIYAVHNGFFSNNTYCYNIHVKID